MTMGSVASILTSILESDGLSVLVSVVDFVVVVILLSSSPDSDMVVVASNVIVAGKVVDSLDTAKIGMKKSY